MLDYAKFILPKVSFSSELFKKELTKCIKWVESDEVQELHDWCYDNFQNKYADILDEVFAYIAA
jgi:hypothetical protein